MNEKGSLEDVGVSKRDTEVMVKISRVAKNIEMGDVDLELPKSSIEPSEIEVGNRALVEFRNTQRAIFRALYAKWKQVNISIEPNRDILEQLIQKSANILATNLGYMPVPMVEMEAMAIVKYVEFTKFFDEIINIEDKSLKIDRVNKWLSDKYGDSIDWRAMRLRSLIDILQNNQILIPPYSSFVKELTKCGLSREDFEDDFNILSKKIINFDKMTKVQKIQEWISLVFTDINWDRFDETKYWEEAIIRYGLKIPNLEALKVIKKLGLTKEDFSYARTEVEPILQKSNLDPLTRISQVKEYISKKISDLVDQVVDWENLTVEYWDDLCRQCKLKSFSYKNLQDLLRKYDYEFTDLYLDDRQLSFERKKLIEFLTRLKAGNHTDSKGVIIEIRSYFSKIIEEDLNGKIDWSEMTSKYWNAIRETSRNKLPNYKVLNNILKEFELNASDLKGANTLDENIESIISNYIEIIYSCIHHRAVELLEPIVLAIRQIAVYRGKNEDITDEDIRMFILGFFDENTNNDQSKQSLIGALNQFLDSKFDTRTPPLDYTSDTFFNQNRYQKNRQPDQSRNPLDKIKNMDALLRNLPESDQSEDGKLRINSEILAQYIIYDILNRLFNETFEFNKATEKIAEFFSPISDYADSNKESIAVFVRDKLDEILGSKGSVDGKIKPSGMVGLNEQLIQYQEKVFVDDPSQILYPTVKQLYVIYMMTSGSHLQTKLTDLNYPVIMDFSACGTGKTLTMAGQICMSQEKMHFIFAENANVEGIKQECQKFLGKEVKIIDLKDLEEATFEPNIKYIVVGTYDNLTHFKNAGVETVYKLVDSVESVRIYFDEAHRLKDYTTDRTGNLVALFDPHKIAGIYLATATPISVSANDLASLMKISCLGLPQNSSLRTIYNIKPNNTINGAKIDDVFWLRNLLIQYGMVASQREIPDTVNLPKMEQKRPKIRVNLDTMEGQASFKQLVDMGLLKCTNRAELADLFVKIKINPEAFGLEYENGYSFENQVMASVANGEKLIIYTDYTNHYGIIDRIQAVLRSYTDNDGNRLILDSEIVLFTGKDGKNRFSDLQLFINSNGQTNPEFEQKKICIATSAISTSIDGLQGKKNIKNSAVTEMIILSSPPTHAQLTQLRGRLVRANGEENITTTFSTPEIWFEYLGKSISLEELQNRVIEHRGELANILFDGNTSDITSAPSIQSVLRYFREHLFEIIEKFEVNNSYFDYPENSEGGELIRLEIVDRAPNPDLKLAGTINTYFRGDAEISQETMSFDEWQKYHEIRKGWIKKWLTIPSELANHLLIKKLTDLPKRNMKILEIGPGTTPVLASLDSIGKIQLCGTRNIDHYGIDIFPGYKVINPEDTISGLSLKMEKLAQIHVNTPLQENDRQAEFDNLNHILNNRDTLSNFKTHFIERDYRFYADYPENLDYIISSISWYCWDREKQAALLSRLTEKLNPGGEIILVCPRTILEKVNTGAGNLTNSSILYQNLINLGLKPSKFFINQGLKTDLEGIYNLPGGLFAGISFAKN